MVMVLGRSFICIQTGQELLRNNLVQITFADKNYNNKNLKSSSFMLIMFYSGHSPKHLMLSDLILTTHLWVKNHYSILQIRKLFLGKLSNISWSLLDESNIWIQICLIENCIKSLYNTTSLKVIS